MPSRRLRVARRFWSSSRALSWGRSAGGTAWPGASPSEWSAWSRSSASRSSVIAFASSPAISRNRAAVETAVGRGADLECEPERLGATAPGLFAGGEAMRHADVALRLAGGPLGQLGVDAVASDEQGGDLGDAGHLEPDGAHAGSDRGDEVGLARRAEDPHGALGRLLELFQEEVRGLLGHAVGVLDDDDPVSSDGRRVVRPAHDLAHVVALDDDALGRQHVQVGVAARLDLDARGLVAVGVARDERRRERVGEVRSPGTGRAGDEPRVGHLVRTGARGLGGRTEDADRRLLPGQLAPHAHVTTLPSAADRAAVAITRFRAAGPRGRG